MQQKTKCARLKLEVLSCSQIYLIRSLNKPEELQNLAPYISLITEFVQEVILPSYPENKKEASIKLTQPILTGCRKFLKMLTTTLL